MRCSDVQISKLNMSTFRNVFISPTWAQTAVHDSWEVLREITLRSRLLSTWFGNVERPVTAIVASTQLLLILLFPRISYPSSPKWPLSLIHSLMSYNPLKAIHPYNFHQTTPKQIINMLIRVLNPLCISIGESYLNSYIPSIRTVTLLLKGFIRIRDIILLNEIPSNPWNFLQYIVLDNRNFIPQK